MYSGFIILFFTLKFNLKKIILLFSCFHMKTEDDLENNFKNKTDHLIFTILI